MRLNRYLASCGLGSRRSVEKFILAGKIFINGKVVSEPGRIVDVGQDLVELSEGGNRKKLTLYSDQRVYLLHKPLRTICSRYDPKNRSRTVYEYLPKDFSDARSIGRLDVMTSGLLLFSRDGELQHRLSHPSYRIPRIYQVELNDELSDEIWREITKGIWIDGRKTGKPELIQWLPDRKGVQLALGEGRNREVRRLFEHVGLKLKSLKRISYAGMQLGKLQPGQGRFLTKLEQRKLYSLVDLAIHYS